MRLDPKSEGFDWHTSLHILQSLNPPVGITVFFSSNPRMIQLEINVVWMYSYQSSDKIYLYMEIFYIWIPAFKPDGQYFHKCPMLAVSVGLCKCNLGFIWQCKNTFARKSLSQAFVTWFLNKLMSSKLYSVYIQINCFKQDKGHRSRFWFFFSSKSDGYTKTLYYLLQPNYILNKTLYISSLMCYMWHSAYWTSGRTSFAMTRTASWHLHYKVMCRWIDR